MNEKSPKLGEALPYINTLPTVGVTLAINLVMAFVFNFGREINLYSVLTDAVICAIITSIINVLLTRSAVKKLREGGMLPAEAPASAFMQRLPRNPALLILVFSVVFALIMFVFTFAIMRFYEIETYTFPRFLVWKLVYSAILSAKICEFATLRYVQPDCKTQDEPVQTGAQTVKNPLPRRENFKNLFDTVTDDFGFNMLVGIFLGGTIIYEHNLIIPPTTRSGIVIGGCILAIIISVRMVLPIATEMKKLRDTGALPVMEKRTWVARLPEKPSRFMLTLMLPIMLVSAVVLWAVLTFFGFETLNFFQFFIIRTIYVSLLSKPVSLLAVLRYCQSGATTTTDAKI